MYTLGSASGLCFIDLYVYLCVNTNSLNHFNFSICNKIQQSAFNHCVIFQDYLGYLWLLYLHILFRTKLYIFTKTPARVNGDCIIFIYKFLENINFIILVLLINKQNVCLHLVRYSTSTLKSFYYGGEILPNFYLIYLIMWWL